MSTFKARGFRKSINDKNKKEEIAIRKSGHFHKSKPFRFINVGSNPFYEEVVNVFSETFKLGVFQGEEYPITSVVEQSNHYSIIKSPSFVVGVGESYFRITPNKKGGLHLSRFQVVENMRGKGLGSLMMGAFIRLVLDTIHNVYENGGLSDDDFIPVIDLEVLDSVGHGAKAIKVDVDKTVSFYEKFGFIVVEGNDVHKIMELDLKLAVDSLGSIGAEMGKCLIKVTN